MMLLVKKMEEIVGKSVGINLGYFSIIYSETNIENSYF